jgi:formiminoglutamase
MKLPVLLSVPHGGLRIPPEVEDLCVLSEREIAEDGDEGASGIYALEEHVAGFAATDIARAIVDMNRADDDFSKDGVIKTHTCWDVPVYRSPPSGEIRRRLMERYYRPYHDRLRELSATGIRLGIDCHTMAAKGPPVGPDAGRLRPHLCLSDGGGTLPKEWLEGLADALASTFGERPSINDPFKGGFTIRSHAAEMPWVQLEMSRAPFLSVEAKRKRLLTVLQGFCSLLITDGPASKA